MNPPTMDEGQVLVEWDWVYAKPRYRVLHHVTKPAEAEGDEDWPVNGYDARSACGLLLRGAAIPGVFSRMGCPRCSRCCDRLGYPRGVGFAEERRRMPAVGGGPGRASRRLTTVAG